MIKSIFIIISLSLTLYSTNIKETNGLYELKKAIVYYNKDDLVSAKVYFTKALNSGELDSIKYLLEIAVYNKDKLAIQRYIKLANKNNITIDELILDEIAQSKNKKSKVMKYIEKETFNISKKYIISILKIISSLDGAFKNLGYEVNEYIIHNGLEPKVELILNKIPNAQIDEDMAMLIAGDNALKKSVLNSLIWANALIPFIKNEVNHKLSRVELEVGADATAKLVTKRIDDD